MEDTQNKFGLSKKTNIALAAIVALSTASDISTEKAIAISVISVLAIIVQGVIDWQKGKK